MTRMTAIAITAAAAPAPISTRGDACRPRGVPFERTGGAAAAAARLRSLLRLPLAMRGQGSRAAVVPRGRERQESGEKNEPGEGEGRDRHPPELVEPFGRAPAGRGGEACCGLLDDAVLDEQVVHRHARAYDRKHQQIADHAVVASDGREEREDRERVHADALEPAELAR